MLSLLGGIRFTAPYLKGNPTHFQNKVKRKVEQLMDAEPPPEKVQKTAVTVTTRQTKHQRNAQWRNGKSHKQDVGERYKNAFKECTQTLD